MSLARLGRRGGPVVDVVGIGIVSVDVDILSLPSRYFVSVCAGQLPGASAQAEIDAHPSFRPSCRNRSQKTSEDTPCGPVCAHW
jgi:hypothetical protein